jgi:uncharacterized membrane protein YraQ (UPF0718 family)
MKKIFKRYKALGIVLIINLLFILLSPQSGINALIITAENLTEMLLIMPPIFILLGFLDIWVEKETMIKFLGENSKFLGIFTAFLLGSIAAGPLYVAFPFVGVLMKKGSKFSNVLIFIGAWSATKIPISLFEASVMGWKFMIVRYLIDVPVIILMAFIVDKAISNSEKEMLYKNPKIL